MRTIQNEKVTGMRETDGTDLNMIILTKEEHAAEHAGTEYIRQAEAQQAYEEKVFAAAGYGAVGLA